MVFPAYVELEKRSTARFSRVILGATAIYTIAYLTLGIIGAVMFGESVQADLLINLGLKDGSLSKIILGSYSVILVFHIPYIFFMAKE